MKKRILIFFGIVAIAFNAESAVANPGPAKTSYSGCNGSQATGKLQLRVASQYDATAVIEINGVDVQRPKTPFTWIWGDGKTSQGWFPQYHSYPGSRSDYIVKVISHEANRTMDCAQIVIHFASDPPRPSSDGKDSDVSSASNDSVSPTVRSFRVGSQPTGVAFDGRNIWVCNNRSNSVSKLRASDGVVLGTFSVGRFPVGIAFDGTSVWVANGGLDGAGNSVTKLRASDGAFLGEFRVRSGPRGVAFDGENIWTTNSGEGGNGNTVTKIRSTDGAILGTYVVGEAPEGIAFDGANIWVTNRMGSSVTKLRSSDGAELGTFSAGAHPFGITFDGEDIWVANSGSSVTELSSNGRMLRTVVLGDGASGITFDGRNLWVASQRGHTVTKLRTGDGQVLATIPVPGNPWGITSDGTHIWVSNFVGANVWEF